MKHRDETVCTHPCAIGETACTQDTLTWPQPLICIEEAKERRLGRGRRWKAGEVWGEAGLRGGKGIVRGVRCASAALFRKEATQKVFAGRNFTSKPQISLDLELLVLPLIEVTGRKGMTFAKRFTHFPPHFPPTHPNPPHPVYRRGEDEGGAAKGSAGYLGLSHANNISPTSFSTSSYFLLPLNTLLNVKF